MEGHDPAGKAGRRKRIEGRRRMCTWSATRAHVRQRRILLLTAGTLFGKLGRAWVRTWRHIRLRFLLATLIHGHEDETKAYDVDEGLPPITSKTMFPAPAAAITPRSKGVIINSSPGRLRGHIKWGDQTNLLTFFHLDRPCPSLAVIPTLNVPPRVSRAMMSAVGAHIRMKG